MRGGSIFISYRRDDTAGEAGRLAEHLTRVFGPGRVFIDVEAISPGSNFTVALEQAITATTVVLVLIGRQWLSATAAGGGSRRIDDPDDIVRQEIAAGLARAAKVIPVLVDRATMPPPDDLPADIRGLSLLQALAIEHDEFAADAERLAAAVVPIVGGARGATTRRSRAVAAAALFVAVTVLSVGGWLIQRRAAERRAVAESQAARVERQQKVDAAVVVAEGQVARDQLAEALGTLEEVLPLDADGARAHALAEEIAMRWLRELRVRQSDSRTEAMARPLALLDRRVAVASGTRKADILAHLGWATFLRMQDGNAQVVPDGLYRDALALDPVNPYANVMLGHWLLWKTRDQSTLEEARRLFRAAADAGRATDVVRRFQISALDNNGTEGAAVELVRVLDEMRRRNERLTPGLARAVWNYYYLALRPNGDVSAAALLASVPPADHRETLEWAFSPLVADDPSLGPQYRYWSARTEAAAGDTEGARRHLLALQREVRDPGTLRTAIDTALADLTARPAAGPAARPNAGR